MSLIRTKPIDNNVGGRTGCQFQSPYTAEILYATVEHGWLFVRDYDGRARATGEQVTLIPTGVSACFANPGEACVTVAGFHAGASDSCLDTYLMDVWE